MVDLSDWYVIMSNREGGSGRYDAIFEPRIESDNAILIEFKVRCLNGRGERRSSDAHCLREMYLRIKLKSQEICLCWY